MFYARLCSFYGWTHHYVSSLDYSVAVNYYRAITHIEAEHNLVGMNIQDYPRMTKDGRKSFYRSMVKMTHKGHIGKEMSFEDFARKMSGR